MDCHRHRNIQQHLEQLVKYLEPFLGLANCHMVDYFSHSAFERFLPPELQQEIRRIGEEQSINLIFNNEFSGSPILRGYVEDTKKYTLKNCDKVCFTLDSFHEKLRLWNGYQISSLKLNIFMNSKKSHEVEVLAALAAAVKTAAETSHVIDIGDGKGYLSSMLAMHHEIPVLGVDASIINTNGAVKRVQKLSKVWNSVVNKDNKHGTSAGLYKQITQFVDENVDFNQIITNIFLEKPTRLSLVGLHTCGNLSPTSLRIFNKNPQIKTICNVGCCYHLLTESFESNNQTSQSDGFPMSEFLRSQQFSLGRSARMIAAQSVDRILGKGELPNKIIFYRAVFEKLLENSLGVVNNKQVGRFRKPAKDFLDYARKALKRIGVEQEIHDEAIWKVFEEYRMKEHELNVFYLIRCMLAPLVEALILLDRLLYLHEQGHEDSFIIQLFDPVISPRCYGIVAIKKV